MHPNDQAFFTVLAILAVMAVIGGLIGSRNGNTLAGVILGFLLGPIGWLITLLWSDPRPKCPECGGVVVKGAAKCKNCGSTIK